MSGGGGTVGDGDSFGMGDLRHLCKDLKLDASGNRLTLEKRLRDYDKITPRSPSGGVVYTKHHGARYQAELAAKLVDADGKATISISACTDHNQRETFVYSMGFTNQGGRELMVRGVHRCLDTTVAKTLNFLFDRHVDGHPVCIAGTTRATWAASPPAYLTISPFELDSFALFLTVIHPS